MDPRRARDPRLARVDSRLQQVQADSSSSATVTPPVPSTVDTLPNHQNQNGNANSPPPESISQPPIAQSPPSSTPPNSSTPNSLYKPRPLFCIVCASNQVSKRQLSTYVYLTPRVEPFYGRPFRSSVNIHSILLYI